MRIHKTHPIATRLVASLAVLLFSAAALAAGQVQWKSSTFKERSTKSWQLELTLTLPKTPDFSLIPMKFEFAPVTYFERAMMDGDKLVERAVPLSGRQPMIESVEVGFMDPGSGKIERRTKFSFKVTRALGFEAGEYKVTIKDGRSGNVIGTPTTLKFEGENEVIDRRAMVFGGEKKKKPPEEAAKPAESEKAPGSSDDSDSTSPVAAKSEDADKDDANAENEGGDGEQADDDAASDDDDSADDSPSTIKEKPGACGCRTVGEGRTSTSGGIALLLGGALLLARRRGFHS